MDAWTFWNYRVTSLSKKVPSCEKNNLGKFEINRTIIKCLNYRKKTIRYERTDGRTEPNYRKASLVKISFFLTTQSPLSLFIRSINALYSRNLKLLIQFQ